MKTTCEFDRSASQGRHSSTGTLLAGYGLTWNQRHELEALDFLPGNPGYTSPFNYSAEDVTSYNYDPRGQLTGATYTTQTNESYQYDDNGNRTNGGFVPGANNQLITDGTYTYSYDNEGNITRQKRINGTEPDGSVVRDFTWDHRNRLVKVTNKNASDQETNRVEYAYDGDDHLVRRQLFLNGSATPSEQQVFLYENGQIVLEFDKSGGGSLATADLAHRYLWGPAVDQLLADEDVNSLTNAALNQVRWPLTDHLGTVRDWINSSSALLDHAEYDAFGRRLDVAAIDAAFGWTGRYRDPLTGLEYHDARWYNTAIQRWMSEDIIWDGTNKYAYVGNAPTRYIDPDGLEAEEPSKGYWGGVGDVVKGYGDAAVGTVKGGWFIVRHPIQTAKGVGTAIRHPIQTGKAICADVYEKSGTNRGKGELVGDVFIGVLSGGAIKVASKTATVTKITSKLDNLPGTSLVPKGARQLGLWGEARLRALLSNQAYKPNKYFTTSLGRRMPDFIDCGIAHEVKSGVNVGLTPNIRNQVLKDAELISKQTIKGAHWHFFQGADQELLDFLTQNGIQWTVH